MIAIVDYKMGNLRSVQKACAFLGYEAVITDDKAVISSAERVILPGVGAIKDAMAELSARGMTGFLREAAGSGVPFLGICLGMQLLFQRSYEDGKHDALGILPGEIVKFNVPLKVPHIGWNSLSPKENSVLFDGLAEPQVYFVHSYYLPAENPANIATCNYGVPFSAAVRSQNVFGTQFHPEKSGDVGLRILKNFLQYTPSGRYTD